MFFVIHKCVQPFPFSSMMEIWRCRCARAWRFFFHMCITLSIWGYIVDVGYSSRILWYISQVSWIAVAFSFDISKHVIKPKSQSQNPATKRPLIFTILFVLFGIGFLSNILYTFTSHTVFQYASSVVLIIWSFVMMYAPHSLTMPHYKDTIKQGNMPY